MENTIKGLCAITRKQARNILGKIVCEYLLCMQKITHNNNKTMPKLYMLFSYDIIETLVKWKHDIQQHIQYIKYTLLPHMELTDECTIYHLKKKTATTKLITPCVCIRMINSTLPPLSPMVCCVDKLYMCNTNHLI